MHTEIEYLSWWERIWEHMTSEKKANIQTCSPCFRLRLHLHRYFGKCGFFYAFLSFESMKTESLKNSLFVIFFTYRIVTQTLRSSETKGGSGKIWVIRLSLTLNNTLIPTNYLGFLPPPTPPPPHTHTSVIHVETNSNYLLLVSGHYCVVTFTCPRL